MILLNRCDPEEHANRWYLVNVQATLFSPCAVILGWGSRQNDFQQWRAIPGSTPEQAQKLAEKIIKQKLKRGYTIILGRTIDFETPLRSIDYEKNPGNFV